MVVPLIDPLHELVGKPLCFAIPWHAALGPGLGSSLTRSSGVIPVKQFPLGPEISHLGPLITFLHHGPPSVVLQSRSLCSIKGRHWTTSEPLRNCRMIAGRNRTYRPRRITPGISSACDRTQAVVTTRIPATSFSDKSGVNAEAVIPASWFSNCVKLSSKRGAGWSRHRNGRDSFRFTASRK